jgi:hypothetical protein
MVAEQRQEINSHKMLDRAWLVYHDKLKMNTCGQNSFQLGPQILILYTDLSATTTRQL